MAAGVLCAVVRPLQESGAQGMGTLRHHTASNLHFMHHSLGFIEYCRIVGFPMPFCSLPLVLGILSKALKRDAE